MAQPKAIDSYMEQAQIERPDYTCPHIDKAIELLEGLREENDGLRENARQWERIAEKYFDAATEWESYANELAAEIEELRAEKEAAA